MSHSLSDHNIYHHPRTTRGEVCASYSRKGFRQSFQSFEHLNLAISSGSTKLQLIGIYRPQKSKKNTCSTSLFLDEFSTLIESVTLSSMKLIIAGDFNFHIDKISSNTDACNFKDHLESFGLNQHVTGATHDRGHLLDLVISTNMMTILCPIQLSLKIYHLITIW